MPNGALDYLGTGSTMFGAPDSYFKRVDPTDPTAVIFRDYNRVRAGRSSLNLVATSRPC